MRKIIELLKEMKIEILKLNILTTIMNTILFFFLVEIVISLFDLTVFISLLCSAVFFFFNFISNMKKIKLKVFEDNNPEIDEMLSTAKDNLDQDSVMVYALFDDVMHQAKKISSGSLFDVRNFTFKIIGLFVLSLILIFTSPIHIGLLSEDGIIPDAVINIFRGGSGKYFEGEIISDELDDDNSIYGDSNIAKLGNEELEIHINSELSKIDLSKVNAVEDEGAELNAFPVDVQAVSGESSTEDMPKESKLAMDYNTKLREIGG